MAGLVLAAVVTLDSIKIYKTHEWLDNKPTVYFKCQGENKKVLPDVKEKNTTYVFKGEESWQVRIALSIRLALLFVIISLLEIVKTCC